MGALVGLAGLLLRKKWPPEWLPYCGLDRDDAFIVGAKDHVAGMIANGGVRIKLLHS
jgi:hypothetical protein